MLQTNKELNSVEGFLFFLLEPSKSCMGSFHLSMCLESEPYYT